MTQREEGTPADKIDPEISDKIKDKIRSISSIHPEVRILGWEREMNCNLKNHYLLLTT
jgi:hypothetical protein